jgi:hypothetical protein
LFRQAEATGRRPSVTAVNGMSWPKARLLSTVVTRPLPPLPGNWPPRDGPAGVGYRVLWFDSTIPHPCGMIPCQTLVRRA